MTNPIDPTSGATIRSVYGPRRIHRPEGISAERAVDGSLPTQPNSERFGDGKSYLSRSNSRDDDRNPDSESTDQAPALEPDSPRNALDFYA
jgi:hypothetical protein